MIPHRTLRSSSRLRPGCRRRRSTLGNSGSVRSQTVGHDQRRIWTFLTPVINPPKADRYSEIILLGVLSAEGPRIST
jgi:hypothetical protein